MLFPLNGTRRTGRGKSPAVGRGVGGSGVVPPPLLTEDRVPKFYVDQIEMCGAATISSTPNTTLVRKMMLSSQLSEETLADIWTLCNRTKPGGQEFGPRIQSPPYMF